MAALRTAQLLTPSSSWVVAGLCPHQCPRNAADTHGVTPAQGGSVTTPSAPPGGPHGEGLAQTLGSPGVESWDCAETQGGSGSEEPCRLPSWPSVIHTGLQGGGGGGPPVSRGGRGGLRGLASCHAQRFSKPSALTRALWSWEPPAEQQHSCRRPASLGSSLQGQPDSGVLSEKVARAALHPGSCASPPSFAGCTFLGSSLPDRRPRGPGLPGLSFVIVVSAHRALPLTHSSPQPCVWSLGG